MGRPRVQPEKLPFLMNLWELIMLTLFNWEKKPGEIGIKLQSWTMNALLFFQFIA